MIGSANATFIGRIRDFILFLLFFALSAYLLTGNAFCQVRTPCLKKDARGRWRMERGGNLGCVQYTKSEFRQVVDRLTQLEAFKVKLQATCDRRKEKLKALDENWKKSQLNWSAQSRVLGNLVAYNQKEAKTWRDAFYELKKQKVPSRPWHEHPALWFTVGVVATVGIIGVTAVIINALQPRTAASANPLMAAPSIRLRNSYRPSLNIRRRGRVFFAPPPQAVILHRTR